MVESMVSTTSLPGCVIPAWVLSTSSQLAKFCSPVNASFSLASMPLMPYFVE